MVTELRCQHMSEDRHLVVVPQTTLHIEEDVINSNLKWSLYTTRNRKYEIINLGLSPRNISQDEKQKALFWLKKMNRNESGVDVYELMEAYI